MPVPESRGSHVSNLRSSCSSGSCASLTLFMDRARPARYLHPRYEDEKSDDRDLISAAANLFAPGGSNSEHLSSSSLYFSFPFSVMLLSINAYLSRLSLAIFSQKKATC